MNENILEEIVAETYRNEFGKFDNVQTHRFSVKHRFAMKQILARCKRNVDKLKQQEYKKHFETIGNHRLSFRKRIIILAVIIILMTMLVGWIAVFISRDFHGTVYQDHTKLMVVNYENCPQTIEYKYSIYDVPNGFEVVETISTPILEHTIYFNNSSNQSLYLIQWVKSCYKPNFNTEHNKIEDVEFDNHNAISIDFSDGKHYSSILAWDNGDYIIEIGGDLDKSTIIYLAKSIKIQEN